MIDFSERKKRLERALRVLSTAPSIVVISDWINVGGNLTRTLTCGVRMLKTDKRFSCAETFIDPQSPKLYRFQYRVVSRSATGEESSFFRYECHPELGGSNPYVVVPHFHPGTSNDDLELKELHFPFTRATREAVAFALIQWLRVDFLKRFGHALD